MELPGAVVIGAVQAGSWYRERAGPRLGGDHRAPSHGIGSQFTGFQVLHEEGGATPQGTHGCRQQRSALHPRSLWTPVPRCRWAAP